MNAAQQYFEGLKMFLEVTAKEWNGEIDKAQQYITEQKAANKNTLYVEIRLNKQLKYMNAIHELLQLATNAVSEVPKPTNYHNPPNTTLYHPGDRVTIAAMPLYSNQVMLEKIYNQNEEILTLLETKTT